MPKYQKGNRRNSNETSADSTNSNKRKPKRRTNKLTSPPAWRLTNPVGYAHDLSLHAFIRQLFFFTPTHTHSDIKLSATLYKSSALNAAQLCARFYRLPLRTNCYVITGDAHKLAT